MPKPLVTISGRPLISYIVEALQKVGVRNLHVVVGADGDSLAAALRPRLRPLFYVVSAIVALNMNVFYGLGYGVGASALATVVVQLGAASVYAAVVVRAAVVEGAGMRPDRHAIRSAGSDGWLLFLRTLFLRGAFFVLTAATARLGEIARLQRDVRDPDDRRTALPRRHNRCGDDHDRYRHG